MLSYFLGETYLHTVPKNQEEGKPGQLLKQEMFLTLLKMQNIGVVLRKKADLSS